MAKDNYTKLHELSKRTAVLGSISSLLEWDQETYMPGGAIGARSLQLEEMSGLIHKQKTSGSFAKILSTLIDLESGKVLDSSLPHPKQAALREWRRDYLKASKLPASFVKKSAKITSIATHKWIKAKEQNDFKAFLPHLEKIVDMSRKKSEILGYKDHPYDALLDLYEPNMTTKILHPLFDKLKGGLTELLKSIQSSRPIKQDFLFGHFSSQKQMEFGMKLLQAMGFDPKLSRLDQSSHPFCMGIHPNDTRMTTRIHPSSPLSNIFSVIHEGGHGLYNKGLPEEQFGSPLGEPISLGLDESQSRFWETRIGRSFPFWQGFFPVLQEHFPEQLKQISLEEFYSAINVVKPSFIRVEADEVTYSLHVIVRFELEKALIEGSLQAKEIPEAWNAKMNEYLGITPKNDAEGCLQDIHWSMGGFGYFPTYTLGNLYAAQFFIAFEKEHPNWKGRVSQGQLDFIAAWLEEKIHRFGREFLPNEIIERVTGEPLTERHFLRYLENKYKPLYHI